MEPDDGRKESQRILDRVARESELSTPVFRIARRARDHASASDVDQEDWAELWGTRIGRAFAFVIVLVILAWLIFYLLGGG